MKPLTLASYIATAAALALIGVLVYATIQRGSPIARGCTAEAMICPDGSAVGREGPNCEFAACPNDEAMFVQEGTLVWNDPLPPVGPGSLVYEKDGQTYTKNLAMDMESMCGGGGTVIACMATSASPDIAFGGGKRIRITGIDRGADLLVRRLEVVGTSTAETKTATVTARIGQQVSALGVSITPHEITEDSRCPQDVQCVWAGTVKVRASLESGLGVAPVTFEVGFPISTEAEFVTLTSISPAPFQGVTIEPQSYRLTFEISKRPLMQ